MIRLKDLREERDVLQKDLAKAVHRTRACISSWEQGKTEPSIDDLIKLADFFDITIDYLVGRETYGGSAMSKLSNNRDLRGILNNMFLKMSENEQHRTLGFMQAMLHDGKF